MTACYNGMPDFMSDYCEVRFTAGLSKCEVKASEIAVLL